MLKKFLAICASGVVLCASAVDVNKGTGEELTAVKGIGPAVSERIVAERKNGSFKNWEDLIARVKGLGGNSAARFSANGLTVNGSAYKAAAPAVPAKGTPAAARPASGKPAGQAARP